MKPEEIYNIRQEFIRWTPAGKKIIPQRVFLKEFDPGGHDINDRLKYRDIIKEVPKDKKTYGEMAGSTIITPIERVSIPLQQIIATKQITHICGNNLQFIDASPSPTEEAKKALISYKQGWLKRNMEVLKYKFVESLKITGDAAAFIYLKNQKVKWRVFSYMYGDRLHPVYDSFGNLMQFGRSYRSFNPVTQKADTYLEIWDDRKMSRYKQSSLDNSGWELLAQEEHKFNGIPVVYTYNPSGACWSPVQDLINKLEIALSQLFENNKSYAFRILFVKGGFKIEGDLKGQARAIITEDKESDAKFLEKADASSSFQTQLDYTLKFIERGSFIVFPPEIKSGDTPSVAIKVVYSPAFEQAMKDINYLNEPMDQIVDLFKYAYGIEAEQTSTFEKLDIRGELIPYIHTNEQEYINNINQSVINHSISQQTAAEIHPYAKNDEYKRMVSEQIQEITEDVKIEKGE